MKHAARDYPGALTMPRSRGAVSGLGIANLFLAVGETFRLRRFAARG